MRTISLNSHYVVLCTICFLKHVAQLWQKDRANLDTFSIDVQRYSQNHAQNWIFLGHPMGASRAMYALYLKILTQRNLLAEFHRENLSFARKTAN